MGPRPWPRSGARGALASMPGRSTLRCKLAEKGPVPASARIVPEQVRRRRARTAWRNRASAGSRTAAWVASLDRPALPDVRHTPPLVPVQQHYPLPTRPALRASAEERTSHWPSVSRCPVLLLSGEADPFAPDRPAPSPSGPCSATPSSSPNPRTGPHLETTCWRMPWTAPRGSSWPRLMPEAEVADGFDLATFSAGWSGAVRDGQENTPKHGAITPGRTDGGQREDARSNIDGDRRAEPDATARPPPGVPHSCSFARSRISHRRHAHRAGPVGRRHHCQKQSGRLRAGPRGRTSPRSLSTCVAYDRARP
jgi:hypothetical protein